MNDPASAAVSLSTEQQFRIAHFQRQLELLTQEETKQLCLEVYTNLVKREAITKSILSHSWGIPDPTALPFEPTMLEAFGIESNPSRETPCQAPCNPKKSPDRTAAPVDTDQVITPNRIPFGESDPMPYCGWTDL